MDIEQLVALVTKQVRERLETFEKRKKVLLLGSCDQDCMESLHSMFESSGYSLCAMEAYKEEKELDAFDLIIIPKNKFRQMGQLSKAEDAGVAEKACGLDKKVITERDIHRLAGGGCKELRVARGTVITPLALDTAKVREIRIVRV